MVDKLELGPVELFFEPGAQKEAAQRGRERSPKAHSPTKMAPIVRSIASFIFLDLAAIPLRTATNMGSPRNSQ
jgi:hypothetical protein